jgi:hypothetical protein
MRKCRFISEGSLQESLYDSVVQWLSPVWMVAIERFQGRKAHFRVNRAVGLTDPMDLVFGFPVCRKNYGEPIRREDRRPKGDGSGRW